MTTKIVPQVVTKVCDICGVVCDKRTHAYNGSMKLSQDYLDYQGCAVSGGTTEYDLCDICLYNLKKYLERAIDDRGN